ncbi:MAG: arylsulfatase [Bryobacterales bacterium]|nr:arylsulfatase [Bryobacterales bacterium]
MEPRSRSISQVFGRRRFLQLGGAAIPLAGQACSPRTAGPEPRRPNIVVIMSDDMGYSDLGCYGGEIATPNLDRLSSRGLRFTRYYSNNMCVPTRASLLSGCYTTKALGPQNSISGEIVTAAEALGAAGYSTYMSGKWHLSNDGRRESLPCQRGFDRFFGTTLGACSFWAPASLMLDNEPAEHLYLDPDFYYTDAISSHALNFMREGLTGESPFFLYVAYTAAHWPLHAFEEDIARYSGRYSAGWDDLRLRRHARMKELGTVDPAWELSPRNPEVPAWQDEPEKAWQERRMEVYAAQITRMDQGVGQLLDMLDESGESENTLVVFQVDNGGCHVEYTTGRTGPYLPATTRDGRPVVPGNVPEIMPGPEDTYQSYGYGWANASNTPFRLYKQHDHEGGITVPLIARWPAVISDSGGLTDQLAHVIDLMPTFLDAAGIEHPSEFAGRRVHPMDGRSLLPVFRDGHREPHSELYWQWSRGRAVRQGNWKLVGVRERPWELYDLEADGTELRDRAGEMPQRVAAMAELWDQWRAGPTHIR